jgi:hypothetical protein
LLIFKLKDLSDSIEALLRLSQYFLNQSGHFILTVAFTWAQGVELKQVSLPHWHLSGISVASQWRILGMAVLGAMATTDTSCRCASTNPRRGRHPDHGVSSE